MEPTEFRSSFEQQPSPNPAEQAPTTPERPSVKERGTTTTPEQPRVPENPPSEQGKKRFFNPLKKTPATRPMGKDELDLKIEKLLEDNIGDSYQNLSATGKQAFKIKGEKTASAIKEMLESGHAKARKILSLIVEWLRLLPGVNRFFIEQEAKIKTDNIMKLTKQK